MRYQRAGETQDTMKLTSEALRPRVRELRVVSEAKATGTECF